jgi:hypothetical protein
MQPMQAAAARSVQNARLSSWQHVSAPHTGSSKPVHLTHSPAAETAHRPGAPALDASLPASDGTGVMPASLVLPPVSLPPLVPELPCPPELPPLLRPPQLGGGLHVWWQKKPNPEYQLRSRKPGGVLTLAGLPQLLPHS